MIAGSGVPEDPGHSRNTLEWLLRFDPKADPALRIAALGHDIERAVEARKVQRGDFADYDAFKAAHARNSAAMLGEIKSRMLLPRQKDDEEEEEHDPRAELIRRLQEYERFKQAAEDIDGLPRLERDIFPAEARRPEFTREKAQPDVDMRELLLALKEVMHRADMFESHQVSREKLSTRERMANVLDKLKGRDFVPFVELFNPEEGRLGVVVTFLATLELVKGSLIELVQNGPFAPIHVKAKTLVLEESDVLAQLELEDEPDDGVDDETDAHDGTEG